MTEQLSWKQEEDKEEIDMKFENKVAIITGSTRGIGRATAELFAKEGAKVVVVGTKEELGESYVNEIKAAGGEAIFCKTDVTSDESLDNLVKTTLDTYGKIDIFVNNAGVGGTTANMNQITMDEWNTVLATNLTAPFILCKKVIPIMEKRGTGTIVNVASMAATAAGRGGLAYTSAKHGLLGLARQMSLDHGRTGVRINTVLPGPIATDMIARVLAIPPASGNNEDWNESGKTSWRTHRSSAGYCIPCIGRSKFHPWSSIGCRWWIYDILKFRK